MEAAARIPALHVGDAHGEDLVHAVAGRHRCDPGHGTDEKSGAYKESQCERGLQHGDTLEQATLADGRGSFGPAFLRTSIGSMRRTQSARKAPAKKAESNAAKPPCQDGPAGSHSIEPRHGMSGDDGEKFHGANGKSDAKHTAQGASSRLSSRTCLRRAIRPMPIALRTAYSCCLWSPRTRKRAAAFPHAIRSTKPLRRAMAGGSVAVAVHFVVEGLQPRHEALVLLLCVRFSGCEHGEFLLRLLLSHAIAETGNYVPIGFLRFLGSGSAGIQKSTLALTS